MPTFLGFVEQGNPLISQEFAGPALGLLPGRHRLLDQTLPLRRQPEGLCAGILAGHDLHPAVGLQRLDVAAEGRGIELQDLADLAGPRQAELGRHDEDVQLAGLQAQRAQGVVVDVGDSAIQHPHPNGNALAGNLVNDRLHRLGSHFMLPSFIVYATIGLSRGHPSEVLSRISRILVGLPCNGSVSCR